MPLGPLSSRSSRPNNKHGLPNSSSACRVRGRINELSKVSNYFAMLRLSRSLDQTLPETEEALVDEDSSPKENPQDFL